MPQLIFLVIWSNCPQETNFYLKYYSHLGRGGGQVVSVLAYYFSDPSSNPAKAKSFFCKICV